ncbi:MAG: lipoyl(octanoyl) transferase LipB [Microbacteriaceae bacterium]|nr:lipoyl(octanoyl) transferase LipB [Microbacteriaceae bacterium]
MPEFIDLLDKGPIGYLEGIKLQNELHAEVASGKQSDSVLLLEHSPVYTAGKRSEEHELPKDGTEVIQTNRGGKITWHGPGQLIGYPIMRLPQPIDVVGYVRWLEQTLIRVLDVYGIESKTVDGRSGVWVDGPAGEEKIAAIGIRVSEKITMHGFALNVNNSLKPYESFIPCGIEDAGVTTMSKVLGREVQLAEVSQSVMGLMGKIGEHEPAR